MKTLEIKIQINDELYNAIEKHYDIELELKQQIELSIEKLILGTSALCKAEVKAFKD